MFYYMYRLLPKSKSKEIRNCIYSVSYTLPCSGLHLQAFFTALALQYMMKSDIKDILVTEENKGSD